MKFDLFNPTPEHAMLREAVREFADSEASNKPPHLSSPLILKKPLSLACDYIRQVRPQALEYNRKEKFNRALFDKCGSMGE